MIGCKVAIRGYVQFEARGVQGSEVTYCWSAAACVPRFWYKEDVRVSLEQLLRPWPSVRSLYPQTDYDEQK